MLLGQRGIVLFPSIDRVVAFLRAYGDDSSLDDLVPSLEIRRLVTPLKTREVMLSVASESSYRMDRIAGFAKLAGGLVFTGTSRHFVKYRDAGSPLGYDVGELADDNADVVLYHDAFQQPYAFERQIPLRELILKLAPVPRPPAGDRKLTRLFATAAPGLGAAVVRYLFRWRVTADVAIAEWPADSAFEDVPRKLYLFDLRDPPQRIATLLRSVPGVTLFEPVGDHVAVEHGFDHPIALDSCASIFGDEGIWLFRGDGRTDVVTPMPPFAPVRTLVQSEYQDAGASSRQASPSPDSLGLALDLRVAHTLAPWRAVVASVVPIAQREWLARLLYALPAGTLAALRVAVAQDYVYFLDPNGIEGVPLGTFYSEVGTRVYVPAGTSLVPAVSREVLDELLRGRGDGHVFFWADGTPPRFVSDAAFGSVTKRALREIAGQSVRAGAPEAAEPGLPLLQYPEARAFPLRGVPGAGSKEGAG